MKLWTFQAVKSIAELNEKGILKASWDRYAKDAQWKKAYEWMRDQMELKGIPCEENAPIWVWHSCGTYQKSPSLDDARSLLCDLEIESGVQTIELDCPPNLVLLTKYLAWNDILDIFIEKKDTINITKDKLEKLYDLSPDNLNEYDSIQGTLPYLKKEWVLDIRKLNLETGDFDYNPNELV